MALKRNSNEQYVKNAAMMHDNASYVPVATGVENPLPVTSATISQQETLDSILDAQDKILMELKLTNELLKGILQ